MTCQINSVKSQGFLNYFVVGNFRYYYHSIVLMLVVYIKSISDSERKSEEVIYKSFAGETTDSYVKMIFPSIIILYNYR